MKSLVRRFHLYTGDSPPEFIEQVETFKSAHLGWVKKSEDMLAGKLRLTVDQIPAHTDCALGKWYYRVGAREFGGLQEYRAIEQAHATFHDGLKNMARALSGGQKDAARKIQLDLVRQSEVVVNALEDLERVIARGGIHGTQVNVRVAPGTYPSASTIEFGCITRTGQAFRPAPFLSFPSDNHPCGALLQRSVSLARGGLQSHCPRQDQRCDHKQQRTRPIGRAPHHMVIHQPRRAGQGCSSGCPRPRSRPSTYRLREVPPAPR